MTRAAKGIGFMSAVALSASLAAQEPATTPSRALSAANGAYLYRTYCASCHGTDARGDGPLAASMRRRPANLTELRKKNNDVYDADLVFRTIDGRKPLKGHGGPDMPVWGDVLSKSIEASDEQALQRRIQALVDYLETRQTPAP
jgi:mono/diheme cytochrome c family protein